VNGTPIALELTQAQLCHLQSNPLIYGDPVRAMEELGKVQGLPSDPSQVTSLPQSDGSWQGATYVTTTAGRRVRKFVYGKTREIVRKKLIALQRASDLGIPVADKVWKLSSATTWPTGWSRWSGSATDQDWHTAVSLLLYLGVPPHVVREIVTAP
jgi:hypothetical protein